MKKLLAFLFILILSSTAHANEDGWKLLQEGGKIEQPAALMPWVCAIDTVADKLLNLNVAADQIASMAMHVALETISSKHGEKWEPVK